MVSVTRTLGHSVNNHQIGDFKCSLCAAHFHTATDEKKKKETRGRERGKSSAAAAQVLLAVALMV